MSNKPKIKPKSCKDKGRRLQQLVASEISKITGIPHGKDCLIESREMGQSGADIKLYSQAAEMYPFSVECKNTEKFSIRTAIAQAKENQAPGQDWQVVYKRNHQKPVVIMDADAWFDFYGQYINLTWGPEMVDDGKK